MPDTQRTSREQAEGYATAWGTRPDGIVQLAMDYLAALDVLEWYASEDNYDDSDCPNYGIPGEGKQINHPLDPDEWDWVPDNGTRARAFLASTEGEQP